jgi:hypothetical protein
MLPLLALLFFLALKGLTLALLSLTLFFTLFALLLTHLFKF